MKTLKSETSSEATSISWGQLGTAGASFAAELTVRNISHTYGKTSALNDISLHIKPGEVVALLGASGSGKSSLLRIIAGLEEQSAGEIVLDGKVISTNRMQTPPEKRGIGLVFQDFALFPHMSVLHNVLFGLSHLPNKNIAKQVALKALERVGLAKHADKYPHMLSGGEQQRVALARAIAPRPRVVLLDEPFSGLDSRLRDRVRAQTLALIKETGATCIVVTHDAEEAMMMADRIALLFKGRLLAYASPDEMFNRPSSLEAARFFTPLNEIDGIVQHGHVETPLGRIPAPGLEEGTQATVCVRHTGIIICDQNERGVTARVLRQRFIGENILLELAVQGMNGHITAKIRAGKQFKGDIMITLDPLNVLAFAS